MALLDVITNLQTTAGALSGIASAPSGPLDTVNQYPAAVTFVGDITHADLGELGPGRLVRFVTFHTLIFKNTANLVTDVQQMTPYGDLFPIAVFADVTLGGTVDTISAPMTAKFGVVTYNGGANYIGWTFLTTVRMDDLA